MFIQLYDDWFIPGTKFDSVSGGSGYGSLTSTPDNTLKHRNKVTDARVIKLLDDLKLALELCDDKASIVRKLPQEVVESVVAWLQAGKEDVNKVRQIPLVTLFISLYNT